MLKSMTGFGRAEGETRLGKISVESRSVNHRYSDINIKLPKILVPFEGRIKEMIRSEVSRGRVDVSLKLDHSGEGRVQFHVDLPLAEQYLQALQTLREALHLSGEITLELVAGAKDLITAKEDAVDVEPYWQEIVPVLRRSFQDMDEMRVSEARALKRDVLQRLERIEQGLREIKEMCPSYFKAYQERLRARIENLVEGTTIDPLRFQQEVAFLAERMDITEEIVRAESHLHQFSGLLDIDDPVGRKMDFLLQEINREVNTISAKANEAGISQRVVEIKGELERIREQVQNIE